jgi:hypothetical protein
MHYDGVRVPTGSGTRKSCPPLAEMALHSGRANRVLPGEGGRGEVNLDVDKWVSILLMGGREANAANEAKKG